MATKKVSYNEYRVEKTYTVTAYLTIKAVSERHAEDIAGAFDYSCGWDSVTFSTNDEHITCFDLDVDSYADGSVEQYDSNVDNTEEDFEGFGDDADKLFEEYGDDSDFDYEDIEAEEEETEADTATEPAEEPETDTEPDPTAGVSFPDDESQNDGNPPKVRLDFLAKCDTICWDLTVEQLINKLKELPPNATIYLPFGCTDIPMGYVVGTIK